MLSQESYNNSLTDSDVDMDRPPCPAPPSSSDVEMKEKKVDDEDEENNGFEEVAENNFRIQVKSVFLTYSRVGERKVEDFVKELSVRFVSREVQTIMYQRESHQDLEGHFHIVMILDKRLDSSDPRVFDIDGIHPNIKRPKGRGAIQRIYFYLCKEGKVPQMFGKKFDLFVSPRGCKRQMEDFKCWMAHKKSLQEIDPVWPKRGPFNEVIPAPSDADRRRHLWIWGPPGIGKTTWFLREFGQTKFYARRNNKYPFEKYNSHQVILYDDIVPSSVFELTHLCNPRTQDQAVPCDTRYEERVLPARFPVLLIVLHNRSIAEMVPQEEREIFTTRFKEIHVRRFEDFE